jgi:hypothetical protein
MAGVIENSSLLITYGSGKPWSETIKYSFLSEVPQNYIGKPTGYFAATTGTAGVSYVAENFSELSQQEKDIFQRSFDAVSAFTLARFVSVDNGSGDINLSYGDSCNNPQTNLF